MRSSGLSAGEDIAVPLSPEVKATLSVQPPAPHRHRVGALLTLDMDK